MEEQIKKLQEELELVKKELVLARMVIVALTIKITGTDELFMKEKENERKNKE